MLGRLDSFGADALRLDRQIARPAHQTVAHEVHGRFLAIQTSIYKDHSGLWSVLDSSLEVMPSAKRYLL